MDGFHELTGNPAVSIILPTYNRANLISRAIESVLSQTFPDFELIIIDDGSSDNTREIVSKFKDPRVIYRWVPNGERSQARNTGIKLSKGKYIAFLDSDDWYVPEKLALHLAGFESDPTAGLSLGGWIIVDNKGTKIDEIHPWENLSFQPSIDEWLFKTTATPITIMVKKEWIENIHGFDIKLSFAEDIDLLIRLTQEGCRVAWVEAIVANVLVHESNSLRDYHRSKAGRLAFLDKYFSVPDFEKEIKKTKSEVYAAFYLMFAWIAYDAGIIDQGKEDLLSALRRSPGLLNDQGREIINSLIGYTQYFLVSDPIRPVKTFFENLPAPLVFLGDKRGEVLGKVWMSRAWRKNAIGNFQEMRQSVLQAVWNSPACIKDQGIRSLLFQAVFGQRIWRAGRNFVSLGRGNRNSATNG